MATPKEIFEQRIPAQLQKNVDKVKAINAKYKFILNGDDGGTWVVDLTANPPTVTAGEGDAQCTVEMSAADFGQMMAGTLNAQMAFMSGKLKIKGDMGLAMKLGQVMGTS